MANREKKVALNRRATPASPVPPKEGVVTSDIPAKVNVGEDTPKVNTPKPVAATAIARKLSKTAARKAVKKNLAIQLKAKTKKAPKINTKLTKTLLNNQKTLEGKKSALLKNGVVKIKQIRKTKVQAPAPSQPTQEDDAPPVLEPIFPMEDNVDKKQPRKRVNKKTASPADDPKKPKTETDLSSIDETIDAIINQVVTDTKTTPKKSRPVKKAKSDETANETIEDVMNDLSCLITDIKKENDTSATEKPKKYSKKKIEILRKKLIKKENIENTLSTLDSSASSVIDMLDLNVQKIKAKPDKKRRHSIAKLPIGSLENVTAPTIAQLTLFNNIPRSISPRTKRASKVRQSIENLSRRASPYTTRSDSPARILRNGKQRKLKDFSLFEGLDMQNKRRKRLCSDFSGSELSVSKLSGYESDSSFSDRVSLHGGAENLDSKDAEIKKESGAVASETNTSTIVENKNSTDNNCDSKIVENVTDNNSNLCEDIKIPELVNNQPESQSDNQKELIVKNAENCSDNIAISPSVKVPEKSIILDIMKQTFNDVSVEDQDKEKRTTRATAKRTTTKPADDSSVNTSKFYGNSTTNTTESSEKVKEENAETPVVVDVVIEDKKETVEEVPIIILPPIETPAETVTVEETKPFEEIKIPEETKTPEEAKSAETLEDKPVINKTEVKENKSTICTNHLERALTAEKQETRPPLAVPEAKVVENGDTKHISNKIEIIETPEQKRIKENILHALGLQSLKAAEAAKLKGKEKAPSKNENYTGTLKTVIKLNRLDKKKGRNCLKMTLQKNKGKGVDSDVAGGDEETRYKIMKEGSSTWKSQGNQSSDTAGANRKSHYSNRSNMDGSSEHTSDGDTGDGQGENSGKVLVIPEKASSFSIHPGRLCKDECSYCFGKFGLFDTPCHIAQMKSIDRQNKILGNEKHLMRDSCLCDACYRHVDRKSNTPSYTNKSSYKRGNMVAPGPRQNHCHVLGCSRVSSNILRRKWIIKMRKSVCKVINIDLDNPGLHSIPICDEHYAALEHLMVCAMCKRRLARNHIHYLGPETSDLNAALNAEGVPVKLMDKPVVCKLCRYFANLVLKDPQDRAENANNFFKEYKKRLLHFHDVELMDQAEADEPIPVPTKDKPDKEQPKKKKKTKPQSDGEQPPVLEPQVAVEKSDQTRVPSTTDSSNGQSRPESPTSEYTVDYNTLIPSIAMECGSDVEAAAPKREPAKKPIVLKKISRPDTVKEAVEISKNLKLKNKSDIAVQRLGSNPSISVRQLFPGEEDLPLQAHIDFNNVKERTPEGWEKCVSTIQYDAETKHLWHDLQKPYGNQSSFLRHLILLEKYFRNGDLILSPNATHHSLNYSESVHNRLKSYDNIPSGKPQKIPSAAAAVSVATKEIVQPTFTILNAANIPKNTPITISQLNSSFLGAKKTPPGLISLQPAASRPIAPPLVKVAQPQKIKFPITKNWKPNLMPIDPSRKTEKKAGLVQVISGGKPYHITIEDYKKMCAIKRSFEMKNKRLQEALGNSVLKNIAPKKGLIITKTATVTNNTKSEQKSPESNKTPENSLDKLDKVVERLDPKNNSDPKTSIPLPKIPKSLTVIPQMVARKPSRPSSPVLFITQKQKSAVRS